jgi:hypothetical protein
MDESQGVDDLRSQLKPSLEALRQYTSLKANKTAGFFVSIDTGQFDLEALKRIALHFVTYEEAFDLVVPRSRRGNNRVVLSNWYAVKQYTLSNETQQARIMSCKTFKELCKIMCPSKHSYKLQLTPTAPNRMECRHHGCTFEYQKISSWVQLLLAFVYKAATASCPPPAAVENGDASDKFEMLFHWVTPDFRLRDIFAQRRRQLQES